MPRICIISYSLCIKCPPRTKLQSIPVPNNPVTLQLRTPPQTHRFSKSIKDQRNRTHFQRNKREQQISPPDAERVIHLLAKQRDHGAKHGTEDSTRGGCGRGTGGESI